MRKNHLKLGYYIAWCMSPEDHNLSNIWHMNLKIYAVKKVKVKLHLSMSQHKGSGCMVASICKTRYKVFTLGLIQQFLCL